MEKDKLLKEYEYHLLYAKQLSNNTALGYINDIDQFLQFCSSLRLSMDVIDESIIQHYLSHVKTTKSQTSINRLISSLRSFFTYYSRMTKKADPMEKLQYKNAKAPLPKSVYIHDIQSLLASFKPNDVDDFHKLIVYILLGSGLRVSELTSLTFQNYYVNEGLLKITGKGDKQRWVPLYDKAKSQLDEYLTHTRPKWIKKDSRFLLINKKGRVITRQYVYTMIKRQSIKSGISILMTPHTLRHGFATLLLDEGADLRLVQELLGHSSIATTQIYTHIQPGKLHKSYDSFHPGSKIIKEIKDE